jgi:heptosyltransferase I
VSAKDLALRGPPPGRILVVMLSAIGDAVHVLPVVNALKRAWPTTEITWLIQAAPLQLARGHRSVDRFLVFRRRRGLSAWQSFQEAALQFPQEPYDLLLALQVYLKAGMLTRLAPARIKLGFDRARARDVNWLFTDERIEPRGQRHVQDQYFEFLEHMGIDPHPAVWDIPITQDEREAQARFFGDLGRPACAVVVGTSKPQKNWNAAGYARVLEELDQRWNLQPVLVGGPSAAERRIADEVLRVTRARVIDTLGDDVRRLVWLLDGCVLTISPDTGPLHISRALERPVVGLFGYTNPKRTGPWRMYQDLIVDGYAEFPGEAYPVSPKHRDGGMLRVTTEAVLEKLELAVQKYVKV